jgi:NAD(P)-dependent dehydrogenase (short-subunit alcohol dehydrogenase family)
MSGQQNTVLITGAAGQLGAAVASAFHQRGARLVLLDRDASALQRRFGAIADAELIDVDLLDRAQVAERVADALARVGRVHALCHVAGGFRMGQKVHETSDQTWEFLLGVNAGSLLNIAAAVVPHLIEQGGGRIVTVGAAGALKGAADMGAYGASKAALIRLTESMSAELKDHYINVNCVLPSIIDTPDNQASMPGADVSRWVAPEALADVIVFLASDAARAIHGTAIPVTGRV